MLVLRASLLLEFGWPLSYATRTIQGFGHGGIEAFFATGARAGIQPHHAARLTRQLKQLDRAKRPEDMNVPGWQLHSLSQDLAGHSSVWVNGNWRLTFALEDEDAVLVDYRDGHQEMPMGRMFNPPHPGATLKEDILPALGLTVTEAAQQLGVTRTALSRVLNGHAAISPEMARRIEAWLGPDRGGRAELWLGMQLDYDLWITEQKPAPEVIRAPELALG